MKLINEKPNLAIPRKEIFFELDHSTKPTPSRVELKKELIDKFKYDKELIIIKKVGTSFGNAKSLAEVYIYEDKASLDIFEKNNKEAPAEEKVEESKEAPAEEKVEENG